MTRAQIITDLKNMIGPAVEVDDTGLATWVNDAYFFMVDEITKANPDFFTKSATTSSVLGQQEYDLPSDFEKVLMVNIQLDGTWQRALPLPNINQIPVHSRTDSGQGFDNAHPFYYILKDNIGIMPIPDETTANNIKIWYVYTPTELSTDASEPDFPKKYHHILKYGAYANYLDQDDEHVAAERMRQRFELRVQGMVENLFENQVDLPRSVELTNGHELYIDENYYV
jgi:hypothetical protein